MVGACAAALAAPPIRSAALSAAGFRMYIVESGSMEPALGVGDAIVVRELDGDGSGDVVVGDVITFVVDGGSFGTVTHRVLSVLGPLPGERYLTKGDANQSADFTPVPRSRIVGKVVARVPRIGRLSRVMTSVPVVAALVGLCGAAVLAGGAGATRRRKVPKGRQQQPTEGSMK